MVSGWLPSQEFTLPEELARKVETVKNFDVCVFNKQWRLVLTDADGMAVSKKLGLAEEAGNQAEVMGHLKLEMYMY